VPSLCTIFRISSGALLASVALAAPAGAAEVRIFGSDGRQVDVVDARNVGDAVSTFQRVRRGQRDAPAAASPTSCAAEPTTKAFAALGDTADYALAPGGDFEGRAEAWDLSDASVVPGNETVGILRGTRSLMIGVRGDRSAAAYTPNICVDPSKPTFRFLFRSLRSGTSVVTTLRFQSKDDPRLTVEVDSASNAVTDQGWAAAEPNALATKITGQLINDVGNVQIGFRPVESSGEAGRAQIDNVMIDPYRRG
jgi:hypothetical protein